MMRLSTDRPPLQFWAGIECTVNRVGDAYFDQIEQSGHAARCCDLDRFAALGITALRYPVLWERTQPEPDRDADWSWPDERLGRLHALGIQPIAGLVHHGSGPRHTSLLEPSFADRLAEHAGAVAARYPWVERYTPVNEPLTTARFSALYGHWYPHRRDGLSFARALLIQCRAVVLAMRAVRAVNPAAQLVQTDDLGKTFSTPRLAYQADFENERRWLTWDLLCGRVDRQHPQWGYLRWVGVAEAELAWFLDNPCPPDVIGINYYVTSERFLDDRLERYPACSHGGNGRDRYADVEAVRARPAGLAGVGTLLAEAWQRYRLPLAITEVHLGCTREEQMRWLVEVWEAAREQHARGVDVRAVTVWSLLGAYDWDSLVTRCDRHYEPGVFDVRSPRPRPTALARLCQELAAGRRPQHPVLATPGWWRRPDRLLYPLPWVEQNGNGHAARPLLITGGRGTLGQAFAHVCRRRGLAYRLLGRQELDITHPHAIAETLDRLQPWAVINAAGYVRVDDAEADAERCYRDNADGPAALAEACARRGTALLTFSSDLVFDGGRRSPHREGDPAAPLNVYGRSKLEAEKRVLTLLPGALVVRAGALFGPWDERNFVMTALRALAAGRTVRAAADMVVSPTYVPDLVHACLDVLLDGEAGVWHLANEGAVTWAELARHAAAGAGLDTAKVRGCPVRQLGFVAPRPAYSVLGSRRGNLLPPLDDALARYFRDCRLSWTADTDQPLPATAWGKREPVQEGSGCHER
jgi:dTDP-4-dehydrorhamnose reductase